MGISRVAVVVAASLTFALGLAACGGEEDMGATDYVPAAGANTPPDTTPGVEPGASYDVTAGEWLKLSGQERITAAQDYVADMPDDCRNGDGSDADPALVRDWADSSAGTDFPLNEPVAELLAEGCAAALQSGEDGLAPEGG
ncbi:MAG: hypothetical protein U0R24_15845 [Solirubrobacterales bacterium]